MDIKKDINRKISVAPMMDCTDRHDRYFLRLMSKNVMLYSEMVATKSAIHGDRKKILSYSPEEKPLALQVGGSDKAELAEVAKIAEDMGYDEININLGCPSKKVQKNMFGACLMREPDLVAECIDSMVNACKIPVTAKTRIGFDDTEEFDYLNNFILKMKGAGCSTFILHARKAILTGMSPKQNLNIPKLNYGMVYKIKEENPDLENEKRERDERLKRKKREHFEKEEKKRKEEEEQLKLDVMARDYERLNIEEKKVTNKEMSAKYESYEEAEEDFM